MLKLDDKYIRFSVKEILRIVISSLGIVIILNWFFYRDIIAIIPLSVIGYLYMLHIVKKKRIQKKHDVKLQFKELLQLSATGQKAGYSIENSLVNCYPDLKDMYGKESTICQLIVEISNIYKNRQSISDFFIEAGRYMDIEEISDFGQIYKIAYEKSGNISCIMEKCANSIVEKIEIENDIYMSLNEKIYELKVMNSMPFIIMTYINITSEGFFDPMYHNKLGILLMTICLSVYILSYWWGNRIIDISV